MSLDAFVGSVRDIAVYVRHDVVAVVDTYHRVEPCRPARVLPVYVPT